MGIINPIYEGLNEDENIMELIRRKSNEEKLQYLFDGTLNYQYLTTIL